MNFIQPDLISTLIFVIICSVNVGLPFMVLSKAHERARLLRSASGIMIGVMVFIGLSTHLGLVKAQPFPRLPIFFLSINLVGVFFALGPWGRNIQSLVGPRGLVVYQSFRLPLELILHYWALNSVIPIAMTWNGSNWDVITGILAAMGWFVPNSYFKTYARIFNTVGILLLINVGRVALMSSPLPFGWNVEPSLQLAFYMPYALIAPFCVAAALAGHILLFKKLREI